MGDRGEQTPEVDVIIPVHSEMRPVRRAAASVLEHTEAAVRVTVIAHNIEKDIIVRNLGDVAADRRVRVLNLDDGIRSPAGPMNAGLDHVTAPFFAVLGSDDEFAPGAIDAWLGLQRATNASVVLAAIDLVSGRRDPFPPVRWGRRRRRLDARRDRLHYRSAPLGLLRTASHGGLRFTEGLSSGEDLAYTCALWLTGTDIAYALALPPYVGHDDAEDRVTEGSRSVERDFAFLDAVEDLDAYRRAGSADRTALAVKILRVHFFDAVRAVVLGAENISTARPHLLAVLERVAAMSPSAEALLSRADRRVIAAVRTSEDIIRIGELLDRRQRYRTFNALVPQNPLLTLHAQAPVRTLLAGLSSTTVR